MADTAFAGFPPAGMKFLRDLAKNNDRDWFQPRKEIYESSVRQPMLRLVEAINARLAKTAPEYISDPAKAVFRVYRDTRFSVDKTPYKTHIAASFWRRGMEKNQSAGFYIHVQPKEVYVAGGVYFLMPEDLLTVRMHLAVNHAEFRKLASSKKLKSLLGDLEGDSLTRVPKGFDPEQPAADLIRRKQWYFSAKLDPALAASPLLVKEFADRIAAVTPVCEYFNHALLKRAISRPKDPLSGSQAARPR
ncbi:MAG: DUF2461 domain-containing protein [Bryobacteraceae bacterium]|nr:DUF2461 domain-containing protein [Bryobacteraceae bacterium]